FFYLSGHHLYQHLSFRRQRLLFIRHPTPPHPLEAARLLGGTAAIVQADRLEHARELAQRLDAVVVLKGAGSVIARPDGEVALNATGNPGLATGGTGDVLAGLVGTLLGQGWPAWEAALAATWLHG
ncbi:NAD(P)H-hydrate dehydratase, partial [Massilia sp. CT11-108]|uniref:ADP-dependent NAD(P)H-hydrate dehydratase n=1 Tax=Massilia sp. CT11-108 TaxID=3393900 RepID=UPI0039A78184